RRPAGDDGSSACRRIRRAALALEDRGRLRACGAADCAVYRERGHLRQHRRPRAELLRDGECARRGATRMEGAAGAGQPARPARDGVRQYRRGAARVPRRQGRGRAVLQPDWQRRSGFGAGQRHPAHRRRADLLRRPAGAPLAAAAEDHRAAGRVMLDWLFNFSSARLGATWGPAAYATVTSLAFIVAILVPLMLAVAYLTLWERKLIGWIQIRIGPNRVGPYGLLQPIADGVKLLMKEIILPTKANKALYILAPILFIMPAVAAWAVIPFSPDIVLADINAGIRYILALSSMGVYGVIVAGWASNSKYAFLGAMRSAAQMVSYELAMGFALVVVLMVSRNLHLS